MYKSLSILRSHNAIPSYVSAARDLCRTPVPCWFVLLGDDSEESDISERQTTINIQLLGLHFIQFLVNFKLNFLSVFV